MSISLFEHNTTAYRVAMTMLQEIGTAAVIHPEGDGQTYHRFQVLRGLPGEEGVLAVSLGVHI